MTNWRRIGLAAGLALAGSGCATTVAQDDGFSRMLAGGSAMQGRALDRAIATAAAHPLGSRENPVRAEMPPGQRAYLARLRCADGRAPQFARSGNLGPGVYGNIIDAYEVVCTGSQPAQTTIIMDMYHRGHVEDRAVPGFTITANGSSRPLAPGTIG